MSDLKPCPFCGRKVHMGCQPDNQAETRHIAFVACYCGGYPACAHKMAVADDASTAQKLVREEWNRRAAMSEGGEHA